MIDVDRRIRPKRWVGIDVGGADSAVCVIDADSNVVREDRVLNSPDAAHDFLCLVVSDASTPPRRCRSDRQDGGW